MSDASIEASGRNARVSQIHVPSIGLIVAGDAAYNGRSPASVTVARLLGGVIFQGEIQ